ncbi:MAG: DUF2334 domain-containing protein [Candidatus Sumerlaeia bacterium]
MALAICAFLLAGGPARVRHWLAFRHGSPYVHYPSLEPGIRRTVAARFDPSFYYKGQRPEKLAAELAERWGAAGVNLVYFRAYDPRYGAFYRTQYDSNAVGEYGRYDLLGEVLMACHARGIRVFAWLPVLNHAGAWNAHTDWRSIAADGKPYKDKGLEFPLCARRPQVRAWWKGFVADLLSHYPALDGIDLAEAVVGWDEGKACYCDECKKAVAQGRGMSPSAIKSAPLTELLAGSIRQVHEARKAACMTTIVPAYADGTVLTSAEYARLTGFDLDALLRAGGASRPDMLCPEFIWQEMKDRHEPGVKAGRFTPRWTRDAVRQWLNRLSDPIEVVAHVEASDFRQERVGPDELAASIQAAIEGGAQGIDIYSTHLIDEKKAWGRVAEACRINPVKRCLILHDASSDGSDAIQTGEILRHFNVDVAVRSMADYTTGALARFDHVFYVGTDSEASIPAAFLGDLSRTTATAVCWLGFNIDKALDRPELSRRLGLEHIDTVEKSFGSVAYKGQSLKREDPWVTIVNIVDPERARALATMKQQGEADAPYAVRCGRDFWYFADVPTSYAIEGGRYLVFGDLLHEILGEDHAPKRQAMVRIEDVHPLVDPGSLRVIADYLHGQDVPFQVALTPHYVYPEMNVNVTLADRPEFVEAIRYMAAQGGMVVLHGGTHQRFGESTADYEFWDSVSDTPPEGENESSIRARIEEGLRLCWASGIYPMAWETPHYAGSQKCYSVVSGIFSLAMERRQSVDKVGSDQYFPYLIRRDRYGQTIVPENLGYVPLDRQDPAVIVEPARGMKTVRDGVASFFFHPFINVDVLKRIVAAMKQDGFVFTNPASLPIQVRTSFGIVSNQPGRIQLALRSMAGREGDLLFPGIVADGRDVATDPTGSFGKSISPGGGELYAAMFTNGNGQAGGADAQTPQSEKLRLVANHFGEPCRIPSPFLLRNANAPANLRREMDGFENIFRIVGIEVASIEASDLAGIPPGVNLLIVPAGAAPVLTPEQVAMIVERVKSGRLALITSGFSALSDEIGIDRQDRTIEISRVEDQFYPDIEIDWQKPVTMSPFDSPGDAGFFYQDRATGTPIVVGSSLGEGRFVFMGASLDEETTAGTARYPHLLTHVFRYLRLFPAVRQCGFEIYFNPAEREDVEVEDLIKHWRRSGVRTIYAAAWQVFPQWTYNYKYLVQLAHNNGMLVYAWFEPPYINEKFWTDHPEWREHDALGRPVEVGWRKPMALGDPNCLKAALADMKKMMLLADWDGVVLNRVGWESGTGPADPASRHAAAVAILRQILAMLGNVAKNERPGMQIVVSYDPGRNDSGIEQADLAGLKREHGVGLQYGPSPANQWGSVPAGFDAVRLTITDAAGKPFVPGAPTRYPTGLALYERLGNLIAANQRFSLYSESSLYDVDMKLFPFLHARACREAPTGQGLEIRTAHSGEIFFADATLGDIAVDSFPAASFNINKLLVPVGSHAVTAVPRRNPQTSSLSRTRIVECSGDLVWSAVTRRGLDLEYDSARRTLLVVTDQPRSIEVDSRHFEARPEKGMLGWTVELPPGRHTVQVTTRGVLDLAIIWLSLLLSNVIVVVSLCSLLAIGTIFIIINRTRKTGSR